MQRLLFCNYRMLDSNFLYCAKFIKMSMKGRFEELPEFFKLMLVFTFYLTMYLVSAMFAAAVCKLAFNVDFFSTEAVALDLSIPNNIAAGKVFQLISSVLIFIVTSFIVAWLLSKEPLKFLGIIKKPIVLSLPLVIIVMIAITPFVNYTFKVNSLIDLPQWMKTLDDSNSTFTDSFMKMNSVTDLIYNLFIFALVPAIGEELLFRGIIQQLLKKMFGNPHLAILFASMFFSAMHMQFSGFIPRMILGMILGFLLEWSGSLWMPITAHLVNNASAVLFAYFVKDLPFDQDTIGTNKGDNFLLIVSVALCGLLLWFIKTIYEKRDGIISQSDFPETLQ